MASKKGSKKKVDLKDNGVIKSPHFGFFDLSGKRNDLSNLPDFLETNLPDILRKRGGI